MIFPPEPLERDEALALLNQCNRGRSGVRNRAVIAVLWRSQLRISEALSLEPKDYQPHRQRIQVRKAKGKKWRWVGTDQRTQELLDLWIDLRPDSQYLFCTLQGGKIDTSYFRHLFKRLQRKAGIQRRCHPHGMRHTGAAELAREGVPLILISEQLGHSNVATTDRYIRHLCAEDVVQAISNRSW